MSYGKDLKNSESFRNMAIFSGLVIVLLAVVLGYFGYLDAIIDVVIDLLIWVVFGAIAIVLLIAWLFTPAWISDL